jgi:hypothetical protein
MGTLDFHAATPPSSAATGSRVEKDRVGSGGVRFDFGSSQDTAQPQRGYPLKSLAALRIADPEFLILKATARILALVTSPGQNPFHNRTVSHAILREIVRYFGAFCLKLRT